MQDPPKLAARARIPEPANAPTETKVSVKEEGGTAADAPKGSSDKGEVGGPGIDAGPSTVGKDEAAVEEKDTPAPPIEEKDPMVEDTPAEEGMAAKTMRGRAAPCPKSAYLSPIQKRQDRKRMRRRQRSHHHHHCLTRLLPTSGFPP
jgi:hypothetical protein